MIGVLLNRVNQQEVCKIDYTDPARDAEKCEKDPLDLMAVQESSTGPPSGPRVLGYHCQDAPNCSGRPDRRNRRDGWSTLFIKSE